jgi:predicted RNA-binding Zn ribbon-like protein
MRLYWLAMSDDTITLEPGFSWHPSRREPAPGELAYVQAFVNSHDYEDGLERLSDPEAARDWFAAFGLMAPDEKLSDADVRQAIDVREALRSLLLANNGYELEPDAVEALNRAAKSTEMLVRFDDHGHPRLAPARSGIDAALARLLAIVYRSVADGTWERFKACPEHSCMWAFYDRSKNRSGTWCSMEVCGNRAKARSYRERRAKGGRRPSAT